MSIFGHWRRTVPVCALRHLNEEERRYERESASDLDPNRLIPAGEVLGYRLPSDPDSKAKRARDVKVLAVALPLLAIAGTLIGLRFGAPHQWNHFATFAKQHPMAIAAPLGAIAIIASAILAGKKSETNKEVMALAGIAALLLLAAGTSYMEAPSILKYVLANPQLMAMPIAAYSVIRLTHHFLSKKKEHISEAVRSNSKTEEEGDEEKMRLELRAGLIAVAALIGIVAIGLLGWQGSYAKIGHFFQSNWQDILKFSAVGLLGVGIVGAILWAFNRGADKTKEVRLPTEQDEALQQLVHKWNELRAMGRELRITDPDFETTFLQGDEQKRRWPMPEFGKQLDEFAMERARVNPVAFDEMRQEAERVGLTEIAAGMTHIQRKIRLQDEMRYEELKRQAKQEMRDKAYKQTLLLLVDPLAKPDEVVNDKRLKDLAAYHPALFELVIEIAQVTGHIEDQAKFANWAQHYPVKKAGAELGAIWEGTFRSFKQALPDEPSRDALMVAKKMAALSGQQQEAGAYENQLNPPSYESFDALSEEA